MSMSADLPSFGSLDTAAGAASRRSDRRGPDRRRRPTGPFSRYALFGGRRAGDRRRENDTNIYVDRYEPSVALMLILIGVLCAADAVLTLLHLQRGGEEANPLMAQLIDCGPQTFVLVKCAITNLGLLVLCLHKNFRFVRPIITSLLAIYGLLLAYHAYLAVLVANV